MSVSPLMFTAKILEKLPKVKLEAKDELIEA